MSPFRSRTARKYELSENSSQTSVWPSQERKNTGAHVRSHEPGDSSRSAVSNGLRSLLALTCNMEVPVSNDNNHGAIDSNNLNLQPCSRFSSLLNFARILLPLKHLFSHSKIGKNTYHSFSKISSNVFSLLDLLMCFHYQLLNFLVE